MMNPEMIFVTQPGPYWDWKVSADLFFGGAGVGALLFAVAIHTLYGDRHKRICSTAALLAPLLVLLGLVFLLTKMGRPLASWQAFVTVAPTSPLWWGGILQIMLVLGSLAYAALWLFPNRDNFGRRTVLGWLLAPIAAMVGVYHGLLLALFAARPLWNHGPTVVTAVLGFVATGIAIVMLVHLIRMRMGGRLAVGESLDDFLHDMIPVRNVLVGALALQLGTAILWWMALRFSTVQAEQALDAANQAYGMLFWGGGIGIGLMLPLILGAYVVIRGVGSRRYLHVAMIALTSLLILIGGFCFRHAVVLGGQISLPTATLY